MTGAVGVEPHVVRALRPGAIALDMSFPEHGRGASSDSGGVEAPYSHGAPRTIARVSSIGRSHPAISRPRVRSFGIAAGRISCRHVGFRVDLDVDVMQMLFGLDGLSRRFAEHGAQLAVACSHCARVRPSERTTSSPSGETEMINSAMMDSFQKRTRTITVPSMAVVRWTLPWYRRHACSASWPALARP